MPMSNLKVFAHKTDLDKNMGRAISELLMEKIGQPVLLLVSGGSALAVLEYADFVGGENLTISLLDDRFYKDHGINNFFQLTQTGFYRKAKAQGAKFISTLPKGKESLAMAAERWEKALRSWASVGLSGRTIIAIMGVGPDGHTAGIMPFPEDPHKFACLFQNNNWVVGYDAGGKNQYPLRLTASISFLRTMVDYAFVYISGEKKRKILPVILTSGDLPRCPARIIHQLKNVQIYTDIEEGG